MKASTHPIYRVVNFEIVGPHTLRIAFDDAVIRTIDFRPALAGELFGPLREPSVFNTVRLDPEVHTLTWSNGADFDPATLHDWPEHEQALHERAKRWEADEARATE